MYKKKILIYVSSNTNFPLLKEMGEKLCDAGKDIYFSCESTDASLLNKVNTFCNYINVNFIDYNRFLEQAPDESTFDVLKYCILKFKRHQNSEFDFFKKHHYKRLQAARLLIKNLKPDLLLISENGITGNYYLIEMARRNKIPVLTCPYGHGSQRDLNNDLERKQWTNELIACDGPIGKIIYKKYPKWIKKGLFSGTLMYPPNFIFALEKLKVKIPHPWTIQGGYTSKIAVESEAMLEHYQKEGIEKGKLALVGTIYCDLLYNQLKDQSDLYSAYQNSTKIKKDKTSILISWPPSYHAERGHLCEYKTYEELVEKVFCYLNNLSDTQITLSFHPAVSTIHQKMISQFCNNISNDNILHLIPKHDIFLTSFSSTIRWAVAARKPVVNYDFYKFKITDYSDLQGVKTIDTQEEFQNILSTLVTNNELYGTISKIQKDVSSKWGMLDGNNFKRINSLIDNLIL